MLLPGDMKIHHIGTICIDEIFCVVPMHVQITRKHRCM